MSRMPQSSEPIPVAPSSDMYTTLAIIGIIGGLFGLAVMLLRAKALGVTLF